MNCDFLAIIPARKNSKRIKKKNIKILNGKPLIWYSINEAKKVKKIDKIVVSSDDKEIIEYAKKNNVDSILRPSSISLAETQQEEVIDHAIKYYKKKDLTFKYIILLQPTSPLRKSIDIIKCMKIIKDKKFNSVVSVYRKKLFTWSKNHKGSFICNYNPSNRIRSQNLKATIIENGAIYIFKNSVFKKQKIKSRILNKTALYEMSERSSVDIDELNDFKLADFYLKRND